VNVDEMDLAREALDVTPWRPEEYERARAVLRGAMTEARPQQEAAPVPAVTPVPGRGSSRARDRRRGVWGTRGKVGIGLGAGIGAVAAAVAVFAAMPASQPAAPAGSASHQATAANAKPGSKLMSLAAFISASKGPLPGDASLIIRNQPTPAGPVEITYNLYTDSGAYYAVDAQGEGPEYAAEAKQALTAAVANHDNLAYGGAQEVAAARYAATGNLATAREQMNNALNNNDYYDGLAEREAIWAKGAPERAEIEKEKGIKVPLTMPTGKTLQEDIDSTIWDNSFDALSQGAGSPQVRAGVLRLLSTVPEVTVANSRTDGQATLTLTADFFNDGTEALTINAETGMPISYASSLKGIKPVVDTFQVSRVTMADVEVGKF
jgi:hypothetical protein